LGNQGAGGEYRDARAVGSLVLVQEETPLTTEQRLEFGITLRQLRVLSDLRQQETADRAGITRPMLSAYERGRVTPEMETMEKLLQAMGWSWATFEAVRGMTRAIRAGRLEAGDLRSQSSLQGVLLAIQAWLEDVRAEAVSDADGTPSAPSGSATP
jgi:transcriptional regulator with XRE-family HTH domain